MKKAMKQLLSDSYILMLKTQNFHWNITGPFFPSLHAMFQVQYEELFLAIDEIAERIRSVGDRTPGSYAEFQSLSKIKDSKETNAKKMVKDLIDSHKIVVKSAKALAKAARASKDQVCEDLAIRRQDVHEKTLWMLTSFLKED